MGTAYLEVVAGRVNTARGDLADRVGTGGARFGQQRGDAECQGTMGSWLGLFLLAALLGLFATPAVRTVAGRVFVHKQMYSQQLDRPSRQW